MRNGVSKQMLLPLPPSHVKEVSLAAHIALAVCRVGNGNRYQLYELVRATYLSYLPWQEGYGSADHALYCAAESELEASSEAAEKSGTWTLSREAGSVMEVVLQTVDTQISTVKGKAYVKCRAKLDHLMRVEIPEKFDPKKWRNRRSVPGGGAGCDGCCEVASGLSCTN